jgi:16S rRNA (cytidine1402-2'-O)-methyltransferase
MSHRGVTVLSEVSRVLAEDTRRTSILLRHYGIETRLVSAHEHNEAGRAGQVVEWLDQGEDLALVSDAGTPLVSDPGARLVEAAIRGGHQVIPIPGPSAVLAALVASGLPAEPFTFFGFIDRSGAARADRLADLAALPHTAILYESPERLVRLLDELAERAGPDRRVSVSRELTKVHEEHVRGTVTEVAEHYRAVGLKGEVVVVLEGASAVAAEVDEAAAEALARALLDAGQRPSVVARDVARRLGIPRNRAYEIVQRLKDAPPPG